MTRRSTHRTVSGKLITGIDVPVSGDNFINTDPIIESESIVLILDYPLSDDFEEEFHSPNGFSIVKLISLIRKSYKFIYKHQEEYGVWGHSIEQLSISDIEIKQKNGKVIVHPIVDS
jgi:hypothetical protein